jgi:hypothetical protein
MNSFLNRALGIILFCTAALPSSGQSRKIPYPEFFTSWKSQNHVVFAGETIDMMIGYANSTAESGVRVDRLTHGKTLPAKKWFVNDIEGGNARFGTLVQKASGYAVYTAPTKSDYYGPVVLSAKIALDEKDDTTESDVFFLLPRQMEYSVAVTVGATCLKSATGIPIPKLLNAQRMTCMFKMDHGDGDDDATGTMVGSAMHDSVELKESSICDPSQFYLSSVDWGKPMDIKDLRCSFHAKDNRLHFEIEANQQDLPGYEIRLLATKDLVTKYPLTPSEVSTWTPEVNISKLPFASPMQKHETPGGMIIKTHYGVDVIGGNSNPSNDQSNN